MRLINILKKVIVEDEISKDIIREIAEKYRKQLLNKFKNETTDSDDEILGIIDLFDKYKAGFPTNKRDIMVYLKPENTYEYLKSLIKSKQNLKEIDTIFSEFKKKNPKVSNDVKKYIKRFMEIQSELPESKRNILKYDYLTLVKLLDDVYSKLIYKKLSDKFKKTTQLNDEIISYYITTYLENIDTITLDTKRVDDMSFSELEHLLDALNAEPSSQNSGKQKYDDIELIYDQNNLKIFAPKTKDQCIKLRNGRTWCTSREGSGNMYYNYRLNNERTLYYVIDEDKDFKDLDFAVVVLVDPNGGTALADGSNSGKYSGHGNIPWKDIENKIPKLKGLKELFEPKPLTDEEKETIRKVSNVKVGKNPYETLGDESLVEIWLEYNSPTLSEEQYGHLSIPLKKKYIGLGMDLSAGQISISEPEVLKYYASKKIETIKEKSLSRLTDTDIALLNSPLFKNLKKELKPRLTSELNVTSSTKRLEIEYPSGIFSKFLALYDLSDFFDVLLKNNSLELLLIKSNATNGTFKINVPGRIAELNNLEGLSLINCIDNLPNEIGQLSKLEYLTIPNNPDLKKLPDSIMNLKNLMFVNLINTPVDLPAWWTDMFEEFEDSVGMWVRKDIA